MSRFDHVAAVVTGVVATAARDARCGTLVVLDRVPPETELLLRLLGAGGCELPLERVPAADDDPDAAAAAARGRRGTDALPLDPVNKTIAVLWPELLAAPVLPLADLYATQVAALGGSWSAPAQAYEIIERAGGIQAVDRFLAAHLDERRSLDEASLHLDARGRAPLRERFEAGWWWRRRVGVVPKLGARTLGIDLR